MVSFEGLAELQSTPAEVSIRSLYDFLDRTLIQKKSALERNGVGYVAVRAWRKDAKELQIAAMRSVKAAPTWAIAEKIALELTAFVDTFHGPNFFEVVVPIPAGSSGMKNSLTVLIASTVADRLRLPFRDCLVPQGVPGVSHPKKSQGIRPYSVDAPTLGRVLLMDDVATSGVHVEMAVRGLRAHGASASAMVWIG